MESILSANIRKKYRKEVFERFIAQKRDRTRIVSKYR